MSYMKRLVEDKVYVQVWLNQSDGWNFWNGYTPGDKMLLAAEYYADASMLPNHDESQPNAILNQAFRELNIDDPTTEWAQQYREDRHRSLSVGDVVVVGESAYACARMGWQPVALPREHCIYGGRA